MKYQARTFDIPKLSGISMKTMETHLGLYEGYVKNANLILEHIEDFSKDSEKYAYELAELQRRFSFEYGGIRNHEHYFAGFEKGAEALSDGGLKNAISEEWGSFDSWLARFKTIAKTRGVGWAMLYFDPADKRLTNAWVDEQHVGHLSDSRIVLALDMWEHSYIIDYAPGDKGQYIDAFFENINWKCIEDVYTNVSS